MLLRDILRLGTDNPRPALACAYNYVYAPRVDGEFEAAGELLRVLSAPVRLAIITQLAGGPASVGELTQVVGQSQPLVSQHLRVLRSVRLVTSTTRGRERIYELVDEHVAHIVADAVGHSAEAEHHRHTSD